MFEIKYLNLVITIVYINTKTKLYTSIYRRRVDYIFYKKIIQYI